jgi:hypothetical protein
MSKQIPILFSTPMVKGINKLNKTQTRRTSGLDEINKQGWVYSHSSLEGNVPHPAKKYDTAPWYLFNPQNGNHKSWAIQCPFGQPGDILWVRETFANGYNETLDPNIGKEEKDWTLRYWVYKDGSQLYSDGSYFPNNKQGTEPSFNGAKWKPSIHMPKAAARIWLQIVSVKVQRLQDISENDAVAEGIERCGPPHDDVQRYGWRFKSYLQEGCACLPKASFQTLWQKINGLESWDANPWVWVVEFKRIDNPNR